MKYTYFLSFAFCAFLSAYAVGEGSYSDYSPSGDPKALSLSMTRTFSGSGYPAGGGSIDISVRWTSSGTGNLVSFSMGETIPSGWSFNRIVNGPSPDFITPISGATGKLDFAWNNNIPSSFPQTLVYRLNVPSGQSGTKSITGQTAYNGGTSEDSRTPVVTTEIPRQDVQTGSLRVTIEPADARTAGAQWRRVGTSTWRNSGTTESNVPAGNQTVEFTPISGCTKPANITVNVPAGGTGSGTGSYTCNGQTGSLRITIEPSGARNAGAQWRRVGTSTWRNSGETETNVPAGNQTVEFKSITGWNKPPNIIIIFPPGGTGSGTGTYTPIDQTGSLRITIEPSGARNAGAQWRRVGTSTWRNSGETETNVPAGNQTVEFKSITGWNKPPNITVIVPAGGTGSGSGTYTDPGPEAGRLTVYIEPWQADVAGGRWRRAGTSGWRTSASTETGVPAGYHIVEFLNIYDWNKPGNKSVYVPSGGHAQLTGTYTRVDADPVCGCLGGKGGQPLEDVKRWLGDFLLLGFSLMAMLAMAYVRRV